jgi:hypothetical protein
MAFRQPQHRPQPSRQLSLPQPADQPEVTHTQASSPRKRGLEESEEWVLFSPGTAPSVTEKTHTTSTERTPRTAGLSRLSDFGSLDTAARSDQIDEEDDDDDDITEHGTEPDEEAELDSLDDGLHAFHEPSEYSSQGAAPRLDTSGGTVLPTHDGLGSFGDNSAAIQQQLWQFEQRYTPKRKVRRTSSVQRTLDALEDVEELSQESDRMRRIEKWRLEQSRALLEEIERETRRMRRMSRVSTARSRTDSVANVQTKSETNVSVSAASMPKPTEAPPPPVVADEQPSSDNESESFWQRFTQRVIRDLIGIDENILSIILGESLPEEVATQQPVPSEPQLSIEKLISLENREALVPIERTWQHRLLERIARELGILVHQLSSHPGAFSTYLQTQEVPAYAGLPNTTMMAYGTSSDPTTYGFARRSSGSPTDVVFNPTLQAQQRSEASLWGIEEEPDELYEPANLPPPPAAGEAVRLAQEREYWERELDVKMVFTFLKSRFSSRPSSPVQDNIPPPIVAGLSLPTEPTDLRRASVLSHASSSGIPSSARRAALIKQHHPLTSRNLDTSNRRNSLSHRHHLHHFQHGAQPGPTAAVLRNRVGKTGSSCASQSTKKSRKSGSSRNYWDIGGSVGSGPAGSVGVWGEVGI